MPNVFLISLQVVEQLFTQLCNLMQKMEAIANVFLLRTTKTIFAKW